MLGKLLKYEIPALGRKLVPLYVAWAATAVFLGIMIGPAQEKYEFMIVISVLLYTAVATAIFVMAIIMIIQRYKNSLLGDEAYFNMVLPVSASTHILNKLISALVWIMLTIVAALVTALIIGLFGAVIYKLPFELDVILSQINGNVILIIIEMIVLTILGFVKTVLQIYTAITIGHQAKQHMTLASIGAYIGVLVFESTVANILIAIVPAIKNLTEQISDMAMFQMIVVPAGIISICFSAIYFFACKSLMEKRLNLN